MVRGVVVGACGYIGLAVTRALRLHGHRVTGVVRGDAAARTLVLAEAIPVILDHSNPIELEKSYAQLFKSADVVIDCTGSPAVSETLVRLAAAEGSTRRKHNRLRFIFTSGCLSISAPHNVAVEETWEVANPEKTERCEFETRVLEESNFDGVVMRPGWVYGGAGGSFLNSWWWPNKDDTITFVGNPEIRYSWIHVDDNADAYRRVVEASASQVAHQIFHVADGTRATMGDIRIAMAHAISGRQCRLKVEPCSPEAKWLDVSCMLNSIKLHKTLGWRPMHETFLDDIPLYAKVHAALHPATL